MTLYYIIINDKIVMKKVNWLKIKSVARRKKMSNIIVI